MFPKLLPQHFAKARDPVWLAFKNELRALQIKPFKRIHFQFDPFHPSVSSIREFLTHLDRKQVQRTNPKCIIKTDVLCNQAEPTVTALLESGKTIVFKTANLTTLELLQYFNKYSAQFTESK